MAHCTYGVLSYEYYLSKEIVWDVPEFFSIPDSVDSSLDSPPFSFASSKWCLRLFPNGRTFTADIPSTEGFVDLMLIRLCSEHFDDIHLVRFKYGFETRRGKEYDKTPILHSFSARSTELYICKLRKWSNLMSKRDMVVPGGVLRLCCEINIQTKQEASCCAEKSSQTELSNSDDSGMSRDFKELLISEAESDLTIQVQGQDFHTHRAVLAARSPVFAAMLRNEWKEGITGFVKFDEFSVDIFRDYLCFLYSNNVELSPKNVFDLYRMADMFDSKKLKSQCLHFMQDNVTTDTLWEVIKLSLKHSEVDLLKQATEFFTEHLADVLVTVQWQAFLAEYPTESNELLIKAVVPGRKT